MNSYNYRPIKRSNPEGKFLSHWDSGKLEIDFRNLTTLSINFNNYLKIWRKKTGRIREFVHPETVIVFANFLIAISAASAGDAKIDRSSFNLEVIALKKKKSRFSLLRAKFGWSDLSVLELGPNIDKIIDYTRSKVTLFSSYNNRAGFTTLFTGEIRATVSHARFDDSCALSNFRISVRNTRTL